jgi:hypothetical protein
LFLIKLFWLLIGFEISSSAVPRTRLLRFTRVTFFFRSRRGH